MIWFILLSLFAQAEERTNLLPPPEMKPSAPKLESAKSLAPQTRRPKITSGNLPAEYMDRRAPNEIVENPVVLPSVKVGFRSSTLRVGDVVDAEIQESAIAFLDSKSPIRAIVRTGRLKGSLFIGEATLERNSKRIVMSFSKFRKQNDDVVYQVAASGLDRDGVFGVEGEFHSGESTFLLAEVVAAGAAALADSTVQRSQNAFGNYVEQPSLDTSTKKAGAAALTHTADRFAERQKAIPEYSVLKGPISIQILITDELKTNNS